MQIVGRLLDPAFMHDCGLDHQIIFYWGDCEADAIWPDGDKILRSSALLLAAQASCKYLRIFLRFQESPYQINKQGF